MTNHSGPKNIWKKFTIFSNEGIINKNYIEALSDYYQEKNNSILLVGGKEICVCYWRKLNTN